MADWLNQLLHHPHHRTGSGDEYIPLARNGEDTIGTHINQHGQAAFSGSPDAHGFPRSLWEPVQPNI